MANETRILPGGALSPEEGRGFTQMLSIGANRRLMFSAERIKSLGAAAGRAESRKCGAGKWFCAAAQGEDGAAEGSFVYAWEKNPVGLTHTGECHHDRPSPRGRRRSFCDGAPLQKRKAGLVGTAHPTIADRP
jgi:hypothetical protein